MQQKTIQAIASILEAAGREILLPAFDLETKTSRDKRDGSIVTATDLSCQQRIRTQLSTGWPDIDFLGEEMEAEEQQACLQSGGSFWCLDPLDGTSNFVAGFPAFALSLALFESGRPSLACIVDPVRNETFTASLDHGAWLNGTPLSANPTPHLSEAIGYIDFKRLSEGRRERLATPGIYRSQRNIGSCALEWAWLAAGRGQFIVHGGEKIWDFAAGGLIAAEAGCSLSDFGGSPLFDDIRRTSSIVASSSPGLQEELLQIVAP